MNNELTCSCFFYDCLVLIPDAYIQTFSQSFYCFIQGAGVILPKITFSFAPVADGTLLN